MKGYGSGRYHRKDMKEAGIIERIWIRYEMIWKRQVSYEMIWKRQVL